MSDLPIAPVDRLMRKAGASRVSEEAAVTMAEVLSDYGKELSQKASMFATHAGRKTIVSEDIELALQAM